MSGTMNTEHADLADAQFGSDPYPTYRELMAHRTPTWSPKLRAWVVTAYDDILAVVKDPNFSTDSFSATRRRSKPSAETEVLHNVSKWLSFVDPPDHTRLRAVIAKAFTPRVIAQLTPHIRQLVLELLNDMKGTEEIDLIARFTFPLPALVISDLLGVPRHEHDRLKQWSSDLMVFVGRAPGAPDRHRRAAVSLSAMNDFLQATVDERRRRPADDLISRLSLAEADGQRLTDAEIVGTCAAILLGGHFTTQHLISTAVLALLATDLPDADFKDEAWVERAVEETLRWNSPVQSMLRIALADVNIGGQPVKAGEWVYLVIGAANRDARQFADPDTFSPRRDEIRHLGFGHGIHFCIGAPLARLEAKIAITEMFRLYPNMRLLPDNDRAWTEMIAFRGLKRLRVVPGQQAR